MIYIIKNILCNWLECEKEITEKPQIPFKKPVRGVNKVYIHCSASDNPEHDNVETITKWHKKRKFNGIGYHYYIDKQGELHKGRSLSKIPAAQDGGHNTGSIAICLGGLKIDNFTQEQFDKLLTLCKTIKKAYNDKITFHGHCEVSSKTCPVFDYKSVLNLDENGKMKG